MCTVWTAEEWIANSRPEDVDSRYTLKDTRYNQAGVAVHTYVSRTGSWWGVLPGRGIDAVFGKQADALNFLAEYGYDLEEKPTTVDDLIVEIESRVPDSEQTAAISETQEPLGFADLVENFS